MSKLYCALLQISKPVCYQFVYYARNFSCRHFLFKNSKMEVNNEIICDSSSRHVSKLKKLIEMEYNILKVSGDIVPSQITEKDMEELLLLPDKYKRMKYFRFIYKKEMAKADYKLKKKEAAAHRFEMKQSEESHLKYERFKNTHLLKIFKQSQNRIANNRLVYAAKFEQNIVFDMDFDKYMNNNESMNTAIQLNYAYSFNRENTNPSYIHFCNVNHQDRLYHNILKVLSTFKNDDFLCNVTEKSFMDIFPHDRLVYLSSDAPEVLQNYDHDAIYIIGAYVDKEHDGSKVSLGKAKRLDVNVAKLPLDTYLKFKRKKVLSVDQVFKILLTMKNTGKWKKALMHVPDRILMERF